MQKELIYKTEKEKVLVQSDDLIFDGKKIVIPSYYSSVLLEYILSYDHSKVTKADAEDYLQFKKFLDDIESFKELKFSSV